MATDKGLGEESWRRNIQDGDHVVRISQANYTRKWASVHQGHGDGHTMLDLQSTVAHGRRISITRTGYRYFPGRKQSRAQWPYTLTSHGVLDSDAGISMIDPSSPALIAGRQSDACGHLVFTATIPAAVRARHHTISALPFPHPFARP